MCISFNKVTSQEAFILEKQEQGYRGIEIVDALLENFPDDLNRESALELVRKIANEVQVAVVYNPLTDELFTAQKGQGAFLNNKSINVSYCMDRNC